VIPAPCAYDRATSLEHALDLLRRHPEAKLLAGGQSLVPLMKLRLATPERLIDIGAVRDLAYVREEPGHIAIGALTRHAQLANDELITRTAPLIGNAAAQVGDPQVRRWGTFGGSLCHADPGADLGAAALAQDALLVVAGPQGERTIAIHEWFRGFWTTALGPQEILREIRIRPTVPSAGWAFVKFTRRAIDWATVGVAVLCAEGAHRVALMNMGDRPLRARAVESALARGASYEDAARAAVDGTTPMSDAIATGAYRRKLAPVLTKRALIEAASRAHG
jgi:carbon-monoxide dehydrogenase medium subunit